MLRWIILLICFIANVSGRPKQPEGWITYLGKYPNGQSIDTVNGVSETSECVALCAKRQGTYRHCYGATYDSNTGQCRLHTDLIEVCFKRWTEDNSRRGANIIHVSHTKCGPSKHVNAIEAAAKNVAGGVCTNPTFRRLMDTHSRGGVLQAGITTEVACLIFCLENTACWGVDFDTNTNQCFLHSTSVTLATQLPLVGVVQYPKICPGILTNVNPFATQSTTTTTTTGPTTAPTAAAPTIGDDGVCPSPFEMLANTTQGSVVPAQDATVNTTELCKRACLNSATCVAADFNTVTNMCFLYTTSPVATLMRGTQSCCVHFRKLDCSGMMMRQCWSQTTDVTPRIPTGLPDSTYVGSGNAAITMVPCTGVCFFRFTTTITAIPPPTVSTMIMRGCDTTVPFQTTLNCSAPTTSGRPGMAGFTQTFSYTCSDSLCNVFTQTEAQDQLLYLPFDMTLDDHSAYMRNGYFWNGTMGGFSFDSFDKQKNKSALFDGMEMVCTPLNNINVNPSSPGLTVSTWVKREGTTPSVMSILSKGTTNTKANSSELFKLISTFQAPDMHIYTFTINLDMQYSCSIMTPVAINEWQFVTARVRVDGTVGFIDLFVIPEGMVATTPNLETATVTCPMTGAGPGVLARGLTVTQDPLCVGGSYVNENFTPIEGNTNFFVGHIDEVRVFRNTLVDRPPPVNIAPLLSILNNRG